MLTAYSLCYSNKISRNWSKYSKFNHCVVMAYKSPFIAFNLKINNVAFPDTQTFIHCNKVHHFERRINKSAYQNTTTPIFCTQTVLAVNMNHLMKNCRQSLKH